MGVAADLAEQPPVAGPLQPVADREGERGDRQDRRHGGRARHDRRRRRIGGEPRDARRGAEDRDQADADRDPPDGDRGVAEVGLDDRDRRATRRGRPDDRPWQRGEEAVVDLEDAEQAHELHHGEHADRRHHAEGEPPHATALVDGRAERASTRRARWPRSDRAPGRGGPSRRPSRRTRATAPGAVTPPGNRKGSAVGSPTMPNADAVPTPLDDGDRAHERRRPRPEQRADHARRHHDGGDVEPAARARRAANGRRVGRRGASTRRRRWRR